LTEKGRSLYRSMLARFSEVNKLLLRNLTADQVQHLCAAISILRSTATQLGASSSIDPRG
jgi:DNA-binding MarR family transcriptional regulator